MTIRIMVVDDHEVVRKGLRMFLSMDDAFEIVAEATNGQQALDLLQSVEVDVVLMDLLMPIMSGLEAIPMIRQQYPHVEVIALTSILSNGSVVSAVRAGAIGYLLKDTNSDELIRSIKAAAAGQVQLSPQAAALLVQEISVPDSPESLTAREVDVLRLIASGLSNKEIADQLVVGEKTIKTHVSNILSKLGLNSRTQAALYAVRIGLVDESVQG